MQTQAATSTAPPAWAPDSWRSKPVTQQPQYPDPAALQDVLAQLARLPPLVTSWEIENLKHQLAEAVRGERFLLQGGDCSESFEDCESSAIASKLKILLQMSLVLVQGGKKRVIPPQSRVGLHRMYNYNTSFDAAQGGFVNERYYDDGGMRRKLSNYARRMGVDSGLIESAERGSSDQVHVLTRAEIQRWRLAAERL